MRRPTTSTMIERGTLLPRSSSPPTSSSSHSPVTAHTGRAHRRVLGRSAPRSTASAVVMASTIISCAGRAWSAACLPLRDDRIGPPRRGPPEHIDEQLGRRVARRGRPSCAARGDRPQRAPARHRRAPVSPRRAICRSSIRSGGESGDRALEARPRLPWITEQHLGKDEVHHEPLHDGQGRGVRRPPGGYLYYAAPYNAKMLEEPYRLAERRPANCRRRGAPPRTRMARIRQRPLAMSLTFGAVVLVGGEPGVERNHRSGHRAAGGPGEQ